MHRLFSVMCSVGRGLWWSVTPVVVLVGVAGSYVILGTGSTDLLAAVIAGGTALVGWTARLQVGAKPLVPHPALLGSVAAAAVLAAVGLVLELGAAGVAISAVAAGTGRLVLRSLHTGPTAAIARRGTADVAADTREATAEPPPAAPAPVPGDLLPSPSALPALATTELCRIWQLTYPRLRRADSPAEVDRLAALRCGCLDQLERRDPVAFGRWFPAARAASDPARFFCPRPQNRAPGSVSP